MALDTALRKVAKSVLKRFGQDITIRVVTHGAYNTATRTSTPSTADTTVQATFRRYRAFELGDNVLVSDRECTIAASLLSAAPTTKDQVVIGSDTYGIVNVETIQVEDAAVTYILQLRAG
jgi:hypothetical protein